MITGQTILMVSHQCKVASIMLVPSPLELTLIIYLSHIACIGFSDMISSMNVLFNLLVVNNWTECEIGYEAATQSRWPRLYFLAFHIFGVILMNNLVVAFIINAFLEQLALRKEQVGEEVVSPKPELLLMNSALQ